MFPLRWNFPFRKKDGSMSTIQDEIDNGGGAYTLPTASADTKGGVKIGDGLTMDGEVLKTSGGSATFRKVWENNMDYQTEGTIIELPDSNYDFLIVNSVYDNQAANQKYQTNQVILKGHGTTLFMGHQEYVDSQTKLYLASRTMEYISDTKFKLSNGYAGGGNAIAAKVISIYAVKF